MVVLKIGKISFIMKNGDFAQTTGIFAPGERKSWIQYAKILEETQFEESEGKGKVDVEFFEGSDLLYYGET